MAKEYKPYEPDKHKLATKVRSDAKITPQRAYDLYFGKNMTIKEIAEVARCNPSRVSAALKRYEEIYAEELEKQTRLYKKHKDDILQQKQAQILSAITQEKIDNSSLMQITSSAEKIENILLRKHQIINAEQPQQVTINNILNVIHAKTEESLKKLPKQTEDDNIIDVTE